MPLEIEYVSEGFLKDFPVGNPVRNGNGVLITNWDELLWAAVTVGRPNRHYVFRHGNTSRYEALFRWSLMLMALEQRGPSARRLRRTAAARTLDPSEKGAVNYFIGMALCKRFAAKCLDAPWAMHLDVSRPLLNPVLMERSRPDLVAETRSNEWVALESKGRISPPSNDDKNKATQQAERLLSVNGVVLRVHVGCITYYRYDVLQFFWRDPSPDQDGLQQKFPLTFDEGMWRHYYQPAFDLIRSHPEHFEKMIQEPFLMPVEKCDIEVGIHPALLKFLSRSHWADAKRACHNQAEVFLETGYQSDGIRVLAGPTWLRPFVEFDDEHRPL
jgi:hypothetical protein